MRLVIMPGMDGTGKLLDPFLASLPSDWAITIVKYPSAGSQDYATLTQHAHSYFPQDEDFVLLAESFGGPIAVMAAERRPQNLKALILCATFVRNPLAWFARPLRWLICAPLFRLTPLVFARLILMSFRRSPNAAKLFRQAMDATTPEALSLRAKAATGCDVRQTLAATEIPMLLLHGRRDWVLSRRTVKDVQTQRPDAKVVTLEGPHLLLEMRPWQCRDAIITFLKEHSLMPGA